MAIEATNKEVYFGTGRRKTSVARVRLVPGNGKIIVNGRSVEEYFGRPVLETQIRAALKTVDLEGNFDVLANVHGGGLSGQAGAIRHGVARAVCEIDPDYRPAVKKLGLLTRDPRMKERKKYGLRKARRAGQFSKR